MRAAVIALLFASTATATPVEPIVFDFEDGLQGWELFGSAQRVQTQVLGGEWAIFGDGFLDGTSLVLNGPDLSWVGAISVDLFFVDGSANGLHLTMTVDSPIGPRVPQAFQFFPLVAGLPEPNPITRTRELNREFDRGGTTLPITYEGPLVFSWSCPVPGTGFCPRFPPRGERLVGFIDNITFHPIPEPGSVALLVLGLVGMAAVSRKSARSARRTPDSVRRKCCKSEGLISC